MSTHPHLLAIATAVPDHVLRRDAVMLGAKRVFAGSAGEIDRLMPIYANAGVEQRRSCVPIEWFFEPHGWAERNRLFLDHALVLMEQASIKALAAAGLTADQVDVLITVSSSGVATPSLDARLMERLDFRRDVVRLPIFGLGCAGGVLGLGRAAAMAAGHGGAVVLLVVVELCGLTFRANDQSKSNVVATALFGDGAGAAVIGPPGGRRDAPALTAWGEFTWPQSLEVMGWRVEDDGFGVLFSQSIPQLVRERFRSAVEAFLARHNLDLGLIDRFLCHPGGAKVVTALERAMDLPEGSLEDERAVLRDYGNMSAATVLFVMQRGLGGGARGRLLVSGLGPGFSAGFLVMEQR